jgi:MioC protein
MTKFEIIVGSVLGASEYVADALQEALLNNNHSADIHLAPKLSDLNKEAVWIFCTSTHGAGDLPDNIQPFAKQLQQQNFPNHPFMVVGLGDSSYDTFCFAAIHIENMMLSLGATLLAKPIHIDVLHHPIPEDIAVEWLNNWLKTQQLGS